MESSAHRNSSQFHKSEINLRVHLQFNINRAVRDFIPGEHREHSEFSFEATQRKFWVGFTRPGCFPMSRLVGWKKLPRVERGSRGFPVDAGGYSRVGFIPIITIIEPLWKTRIFRELRRCTPMLSRVPPLHFVFGFVSGAVDVNRSRMLSAMLGGT